MNTARELSENLAALLRREHDAMAEFLVALADFDGRRLWAALGHPSLFYFLHRELKLSKAASQYRKVAAELIQEVPAVAEALRAGHLCLNSIIEASKVVTPENCETVLPRFYGLSRREAEEVVAELQPHPAPPVRTVVTTIRTSESPALAAPATDLGCAPHTPSVDAASVPASDASSLAVSSSHEPARSPSGDAPATPPAKLDSLTATLRRIHVTVTKEFTEKLQAAADARPGLTIEQLLEAGLDLLLDKSAKAKGLVARPQTKVRPSKDPGYVSAHVKREVMKRSGGRCEWVLPSGERCGSTHGCEFHHLDARAKGGKATVERIQLTCRGHNVLGGYQDFGAQVMDRYTGRKREWRPRGE
jgi:hypothetical protein